MIRRAFRHAINTAGRTVLAQIETLAGELRDACEVLETYGFTAHPPADVDEGIAVHPNCDAGQPIIVGWLDDNHRPKGLTAGEICIYSSHGQRILLDDLGQVVISDKTGSTITLKDDGSAHIAPSSGLTTIEGDLTASGIITGTAGVKTAQTDLDTHAHTGVRAGSDISGPPQ